MLISIFVLQLFQHRKRRRTLDSGLFKNFADFGLRARAYFMLGHIRNAQNELIFDLGQQIEMMRTDHLFRLVGHKTISFFVFIVLAGMTIGIIAVGIAIIEIGFGLDQLQEDFAIDRIHKRRIAPLAHQHRVRLHVNVQEGPAKQQTRLAHLTAHRPRHKSGIAQRLFG